MSKKVKPELTIAGGSLDKQRAIGVRLQHKIDALNEAIIDANANDVTVELYCGKKSMYVIDGITVRATYELTSA